jgi:outer membrane protein assembly factor BamB
MICAVLVVSACTLTISSADDWPTYLHDSDRSGATGEQLSLPLQINWAYQPPSRPRGAWTAADGKSVEGRELHDRIRFDDATQVAVVGGRVYFGSAVDHQVHCLDAKSGAELWSFFTGASVHLAPAVADGRVFVGSDDGYGYCLDADSGKLIWKYRPGPDEEWFLGRGEMISRWPVRTGILVDNGIAYFGAGIFPHENVYVCAVAAKDGTVVWRNDHISHAEAGREDLSPQGYLLSSPEHIYVPSGRTRPKSFDRQTGQLLGEGMTQVGLTTATVAGTKAIMLDRRLHLFSPGAQVAGSAVASYVTTGSHIARVDNKSFSKISRTTSQAREELRQLFRKRYGSEIDETQYEELAEQLRRQIQSLDNATTRWRTPTGANSSLIVAGTHVFAGGENEVLAFDTQTGKQVWRTEIEGDAWGLAVAGGSLLVSTSSGRIYSFAAPSQRQSKPHAVGVAANPFPEDAWSTVYRETAAAILQRTELEKGFCLVVGNEEGRLAYELARQSDLKIYAIEPDAKKVAASRRTLASAGLYGSRVTIHQADATSIPYSDYFANLIVSDRLLRTGDLPEPPEAVARHLKPVGGVICLGKPNHGAQDEQAAALADWLDRTGLEDQSTRKHSDRWVTLERGTLPGAGNWSHQYGEPGNTASSGDKLVQGGLGVLWYGDPGPEQMVNRHQGAVGPLVVNGRMFVQGEDSLMAYDAYNGLFLWEIKNPEAVRTGVFKNIAPGNLAASDDRLFHLVRDHVFAHNAATGEVQAVYQLPHSVDRETHEWGYIAVRDGRLFGTATTREVVQRRLRRRGNPGVAATDVVFAIDTKTDKHLWAYQGKSINFQTIALGPDRVYFIDSSVTGEQREEILRQDKSDLKLLTGDAAKLAEERMKMLDVRLAVALHADSGEVIWSTPVDVTDCSDIGIGGGKLTLMYQNDVLVLCGANANGHYWKQFIDGEFQRRRLVALDAVAGYKLWAKDANYRHRPIIIGSRIIAEPWAFDLRSGDQETRTHPLTGQQAAWSIARPGHHCGMLTGCDNLLVFRSGFTGFYDLKTDSGTRHFAGHRLGCWINAIPANGLVVMPESSAGCICMFSIASTIVMQPREPRRPWTLFSQTGMPTPVQHMALNFGAPGDRRDHTGRLWLAWPRPSDKPRNKSTDTTGLALTFDLKTTFLPDGDFYSEDGDATVIDTPDILWVTSSGARNLTKCTIPLLGDNDAPATYRVRLRLAAVHGADDPSFELRVQGKRVSETLRDTSKDDKTQVLIFDIASVDVSRDLVVELIPGNTNARIRQTPALCGVEVTRE